MREFILGSFSSDRNNNVDALRLIAAFLVLYSHTIGFVTKESQIWPFYYGSVGRIGVNIFFIISGFLITQSYLRTQRPSKYIWSRCLRIFPALIVVVVLAAFVLAPFVTSLSFSDYFRNGATYSYLLNITLFYDNQNLPGVFTQNPVSQAVNGSLWTLKYEILYYLIVLLLGLIGFLRNGKIVAGLFILSIVLTYFNIGDAINIYTVNIQAAIRMFSYFSAGMAAYLYRDHFHLSLKLAFFILALLLIGSFNTGYKDDLFVFLLAYLVLFIAYYPKINIRWLSKYGDFSYGVYIWAFPIIQTVIYLYPSINCWMALAFTAIITLILGVLSWHLIEKRALAYKNSKPFFIF